MSERASNTNLDDDDDDDDDDVNQRNECHTTLPIYIPLNMYC